MEELLSWSWLKLLSFSFILLLFVLKLTIVLWWRPRKIEGHFSKQGIRGPPYRFFIGNVKELVEMMLKASSQPMPFSHNILPRVLSFYHHWKKIYGTFTINSSPFLLASKFSHTFLPPSYYFSFIYDLLILFHPLEKWTNAFYFRKRFLIILFSSLVGKKERTVVLSSVLASSLKLELSSVMIIMMFLLPVLCYFFQN